MRGGRSRCESADRRAAPGRLCAVESHNGLLEPPSLDGALSAGCSAAWRQQTAVRARRIAPTGIVPWEGQGIEARAEAARFVTFHDRSPLICRAFLGPNESKIGRSAR